MTDARIELDVAPLVSIELAIAPLTTIAVDIDRANLGGVASVTPRFASTACSPIRRRCGSS